MPRAVAQKCGYRGKARGGMIVRFTGAHESDPFWVCRRPIIWIAWCETTTWRARLSLELGQRKLWQSREASLTKPCRAGTRLISAALTAPVLTRRISCSALDGGNLSMLPVQ